jgi:hypothetical protein
MRCVVNAAVLAPDYGKTLTVDQVVDLDERLPHGGTLASVTDPSWFVSLEPVVEPAGRPRRRSVTSEDTTTPVSPAASEESHG